MTGAINGINQFYRYDSGRSSDAQRKLEHLGKGSWGVYANNQNAAKALAVVFGCFNKPKVHGSGMYGHYHDASHSFHIWYGGHIIY